MLVTKVTRNGRTYVVQTVKWATGEVETRVFRFNDGEFPFWSPAYSQIVSDSTKQLENIHDDAVDDVK